MNRYIKLLVLAFSLILVYNAAYADHRSYVWTYEYMTMKPGAAELEQYTTFATTNLDTFKGHTDTQLKFELEVGMNEHFDFAVYQVFRQSPDGRFSYDGYQLRSRFKIGKKDQFFLDPLIYLEYQGKADFSEHVIETKLVLGKDLGKFNFSLNPTFEFAYEDHEWEFEPEYSLGLSYKVNPLFSLGLEGTGSKDGHYIGPTISHGSENIWVAFGTLFKVSKVEDGKPQFQLRLLMGVEL